MIVCNGCSKSGTHFLTSLMLSMGKEQLGGTLIKRPSRKLYFTGKRPLADLFSSNNDSFVHAHLIHRKPLAERLRDHKHLFIVRHPRNIAISWMRHRLKQDASLQASEELLLKIVSGGMFGHAVAKFVELHVPWTQQQEVCTVRFEDLVARDGGTLQRIATHVDVPKDKAHFENAFGKGSTYMGSFSDWSNSEFWTTAVEDAWLDSGGAKVEQELGYSVS